MSTPTTSSRGATKEPSCVVRRLRQTESVLFFEKGMLRQLPALHDLLKRSTSLPVPGVLGHEWGDEEDVVMTEWLPGEPCREWGAGIARELGRYLGEAHALVGAAHGYQGPHHPMPAQSSWGDAFRVMWSLLIDDISRIGLYGHDEAELMRDLLARHARSFERRVAPSLLHLNLGGQNILVDRGSISGLVGWERACWGDPELELALLERRGLANESLFEGYGLSRPSGEEADRRRLFYQLYEMQQAIVVSRSRRHDAEAALAAKRDVMRHARRLQ